MKKGELLFFCGKMGAGKSTKAEQITQERQGILLSEDEWLESLYPGQIRLLEDYVKFSNLLKPQIKKLVQSLLVAGTDVIMDFPANTLSQRAWFRGVFAEVDAPHTMIYIDVPDHVCIEQIGKRRTEQPERAATDTEAVFHAVTKHFVAPQPEEGFNIATVAHKG